MKNEYRELEEILQDLNMIVSCAMEAEMDNFRQWLQELLEGRSGRCMPGVAQDSIAVSAAMRRLVLTKAQTARELTDAQVLDIAGQLQGPLLSRAVRMQQFLRELQPENVQERALVLA